VTVWRRPADVVRSRQEVHAAEHPGQPFGEAEAEAVAREYLGMYRATVASNFNGRHFAFRYEDLNSERVRDSLARFLGVGDLMARPLWADTPELPQSAWNSPKYLQPINLERRLSPLAPHLQRVVDEICRPIIDLFGYGSEAAAESTSARPSAAAAGLDERTAAGGRSG
jgi:hypothetical protein